MYWVRYIKCIQVELDDEADSTWDGIIWHLNAYIQDLFLDSVHDNFFLTSYQNHV